MLRLLSVLVLILTFGVGQMWGDSQTFTFNTSAGLSALGISEPKADKMTALGTVSISPVTITGAQNGAGNPASVYKNQAGTSLDLRLYKYSSSNKGSSITISVSDDYKLTGISGLWTSKVAVSTGTLSSGTWTPTANSTTRSVEIYNNTTGKSGGTASGCTIITVSYTPTATSCTVKPTVGASLTSVSADANSITATVPISNIGGCNITENGLVYSASVQTPTIGTTGCTKVTTTACGATAANKEVTIENLDCGTTYYVRGYAINAAGTQYTTNTTTQATSACPTYTVTLKDDNSTLPQASYGAEVELPSRSGCTGYTFVGWTKTWTSAQSEWTTTAPTIIPAGDYTPTADENLYPVYTKTEGGGSPSATITTSLTEGKIYIFGAVKAAASSTLASNTTVAAVAFTSTASWGTYVNLNPSNTGVINSGITDECKWTLTSVSNGAYTFKKGNNYLALGTGTGGSTAGVSENAAQVYLENQNSTCKDAFFIHPTSTSTNRLVCNTNSNCGYRMYATSTNLTAQMCGYIRFYEYNPGTTTSYISVPNCCTSLGQINGSFFWTTHFCPAWPAKHRS